MRQKIGRNAPCHCGSGRKYKKCCLAKDTTQSRVYGETSPQIPPEVLAQIQDRIRKEQHREEAYGKVRPVIHEDFQGYKFVAVGNQILYSKSWKTFPDFLMSYIATVLGKDWGNAELAKPLERRHQILKWWDGVGRFKRKHLRGEDGIYSVVPNGVFAAYLLLAYDLYILRHHSALQAEVVRRLKHPDQFQGARYELFAAATFIRAGFKIRYEDETDPEKKHPEFVATHEETGQITAVEAKSRHRPGLLGFPGERGKESEIKAGVGGLLKDALAKPTTHPYVIFVDLNLPPSPGTVFEKPWTDEIKDTVVWVGKPPGEGLDPFNLLVFTNHPHHYAWEDEPDPAKDTLSFFSQHPRVPAKHPQTIMAIHEAALKYGNIPNEFPGN